ncbi:tRNA (adenosine(37)-N6)-threonylcarbamoyltransferase complex dimerization subunit type 1 TsaB [Candidatus Haliotispira prima]|uniref:tRNA (Adenosine(37)-N6)-threonylcarbamoyltransferase complex dimerization subunit type 1 TsaB n=1 Tax=Candidatus Haliotispira prima TaxID=3034016 RepID=A0ABY8MEB0_9SPIO|nr:tRNA (adenosine(37)-N6)-threonylcarbamoyltransferase complex dimerization subunit type 1 TsaB [Candidatus Haliotispira prima]
MESNNVEVKPARILAISGSNELLLSALQDESGRSFYRGHEPKPDGQGFQHNEQLVGLCESLFAEAKFRVQDVDAIGVDLGPGSFTGQRISLSFAKGLSLALAKPLVGFGTFCFWAHALGRHALGRDYRGDPLLILIDGRKRRFYAKLFVEDSPIRSGRASEHTWERAWERTWDLSSKDLWHLLLRQYGAEFLSGLCISGPGAPLFLEELAGGNRAAGELPDLEIDALEADALEADADFGRNLRLCPPPDRAALASGMLKLAGHKYRAQNYMQASDGPLYLRKSDAEEQRDSRQVDTDLKKGI